MKSGILLFIALSGIFCSNAFSSALKEEKVVIAIQPLPYPMNALEPVISERTLSFHYGKHLQAYINNLNKLIAGTPLEGKDLQYIVLNSDGGIFNNAAQAWNHQFYFDTFSATPKQIKDGKLKDAIIKKWGSYENFLKAFNQAATSLFGSGWTWLVKTPGNELEIVSTPDAETPLTDGLTPLLTCDVWEHAYYLDYQNLRADYVKNFWDIIDWSVVEDRYNK